MPVFNAVKDVSNSSLVLGALGEIGSYFNEACRSSLSLQGCSQGGGASEALALSGLSVPDEVYQSAVCVLRPLARYLQGEAPELHKQQLGDLLATDTAIVDHLCDGILAVFVKETSLHVVREISNASFLKMVLLLQVCLMEVSESHKMREKLIKCGCIHLLMKELRNTVRYVQTDIESNQLCHHLIQSAAVVVSNCITDNVDLFLRLHPEIDIAGTLTPYLYHPDAIVRIVCQQTYHRFAYYIHQSNPGAANCPDTISNYTRLLRSASESKTFVARLDKLLLGAVDLLKLLQCLCVSKTNREAIVRNSEFQKAVANILVREGKGEIECTLDLLLTYLTADQLVDLSKERSPNKEQVMLQEMCDSRKYARDELLSHFPELVPLLKRVLSSHEGLDTASTRVKRLCSAVLWGMKADADADIHSCLLYVQCCYEFKHHVECCYWSDYTGQLCSENPEARELRNHFLLYKAKAKYHIYQRQQVVLRRSEKLQNLGEMKQDRERVYDNAKEVISILGSLKGKKFSLDFECEQFLDYAIMDYIRELNKRSSVSSLYCMLCHKKESIVRSHAVPEAVMKTVFKNNQEMIVIGPSSLSFDSRVKTPHTQTFNMLCSTCDNEILSRDENLFIENIVKRVYHTSLSGHLEREDSTHYGSWLHRFCAGIIFRNLALSRGVSGAANDREIHDLFRYCRSVVLPSTEAEDMSTAEYSAGVTQNQPSVENKHATSGDKFPIALFFTPGMREGQVEKPSNLIRALNSNIFNCLSSTPIANTFPSLSAKKCYYFAVHFGIFTIVAFLEPVPSGYCQFLVSPHEGELAVPVDDERLGLLPPGLLRTLEEKTEKTVRLYLEKMVEVSHDKKEVSLTVLKSNVAIQPAVTPTSFNLLPPKFELNRQTNALTMKAGHSILLHHTYRPPSGMASHTVFLAIEDKLPTEPYVIIHTSLDAPAMFQTFGYYVTLPDFAFKRELDANHRVMMENIRAKGLDLFKLPARVIPTAYARAGLQNYQSILYHLNRRVVFDRKCIPGNGCWYCSHKCDICMLRCTAGLSSHGREDAANGVLRFHSEDCRSFSDRSGAFPSSFSSWEPLTKVSLALVPGETDITSIHLISITHSSFDERYQCPVHTAVDLYRANEGAGCQLPSGCYVALFHVKTYSSQTFGEYFVTDELQLGKPLPHVKVAVDEEKIHLVNGLIHIAIQNSGHGVGYFHTLGCLEEPVDNVEDSCDDLAIGLDFDMLK